MGTFPRAQPSPPRNLATPHTAALHTASPAQVRRGEWVRRGRARAVLKSPPRRWESRLRSLGPWPPRQPLYAAGDSAALAPSRCRLFRQLESFLLSLPAPAPRPLPQRPQPLLWLAGCCRWGFACPPVERDHWPGRRLRLSGALPPRGSGECLAAAVFSPSQAVPLIAARLFLGVLPSRRRPLTRPVLTAPRPLSSPY